MECRFRPGKGPLAPFCYRSNKQAPHQSPLTATAGKLRMHRSASPLRSGRPRADAASQGCAASVPSAALRRRSGANAPAPRQMAQDHSAPGPDDRGGADGVAAGGVLVSVWAPGPSAAGCGAARRRRPPSKPSAMDQFCMGIPSSHRKPIPPPCQIPSPNGLGA